MDWLKNLAPILGGIGGVYGAIKQGKAFDDLLKMQKADYEEEKERKKRTQARLDFGAQKHLSSDHRYDSPALPLK